jgi:hypothetical protein
MHCDALATHQAFNRKGYELMGAFCLKHAEEFVVHEKSRAERDAMFDDVNQKMDSLRPQFWNVILEQAKK